jgi:hypothetical protein
LFSGKLFKDRKGNHFEMVKAVLPAGIWALELDAYSCAADYSERGAASKPTEGTASNCILQAHPGTGEKTVSVGFPPNSEHFGRFSAEYGGDLLDLTSLKVDLECPNGEREAIAFARGALGRVEYFEQSADLRETPYSFLLKQDDENSVQVTVYSAGRVSGKNLVTLSLSNVQQPESALENFEQEITEALDAELVELGRYSAPAAAKS